jgi:tetratricopeptide (TPR) repeat protein
MVRTGSSYRSQSELAVTFGLQPDEQLERLEVAWPSGAHDVFRNLSRNATSVAHEGTAPAGGPLAGGPIPPAVALDVPGLKRAALAHYQAGRLQEARTAWQRVLQHQPEDYIAQPYLIELAWQQGEYEPARALLAAMSRAMPDANLLMQFAFHLDDLPLHDLADEVYSTAARLDPQLAEAPYRMGKNALGRGQALVS